MTLKVFGAVGGLGGNYVRGTCMCNGAVLFNMFEKWLLWNNPDVKRIQKGDIQIMHEREDGIEVSLCSGSSGRKPVGCVNMPAH